MVLDGTSPTGEDCPSPLRGARAVGTLVPRAPPPPPDLEPTRRGSLPSAPRMSRRLDRSRLRRRRGVAAPRGHPRRRGQRARSRTDPTCPPSQSRQAEARTMTPRSEGRPAPLAQNLGPFRIHEVSQPQRPLRHRGSSVDHPRSVCPDALHAGVQLLLRLPVAGGERP